MEASFNIILTKTYLEMQSRFPRMENSLEGESKRIEFEIYNHKEVFYNHKMGLIIS